MSRNVRLILIALVATLTVLAPSAAALAAVTWTPAANTRTLNDPRTWNNNHMMPADRLSGSIYGGQSITATTYNGTVTPASPVGNYTHTVGLVDGTQGAMDWKNATNVPIPYVTTYGSLVPYAGNGMVPVNQNYVMGSTVLYWDGDCGTMRPHLQTDAINLYAAGVPMPVTGTATVTAGGVLTLTSPELANIDYLEIGDRIQTRGFTPAQFNRGAANAVSGVGIGTNLYWTVLTRPTATSMTAQSGGLAWAGAAAPASVMGTLMRGSDCTHLGYQRSSNNGTNWDGGGAGSANSFNVSAGPTLGGIKPFLSQTHIADPQVATYGNFVYATFTSTNGYVYDQCPSDPVVAYVRINSNHGAWDAWGAPIRLTPAAEQIAAAPQLAVDQANGHLYFLYQSSNQGAGTSAGPVYVIKSTTNGASWSTPLKVGQGFGLVKASAQPPTLNPAGPTTVCSNAYRTQTDNFGFGKTPVFIDAYNGIVGAAWTNNAAGDKLVAKVSNDGGTTWNANGFTSACTPGGVGGNLCSQILTRGGAGGLCPGFACVAPTDATCPSPYTAAACAIDTTIGGYFAVTAGPGPASTTRIDFAWVNDSGVGRCVTPLTPPNDTCTPQTVPRGLYFQEWLSDATPADGGSWAPQRLVSCMRGTTAAPGGVCAGRPAAVAYGSFSAPVLAMWGTTGVGVTWHGCVYDATNQPLTPCNNVTNAMSVPLTDPGAEILYKESGNSGSAWGGYWGLAGGDFRVVANNNFALRPVSEFADMSFDNPSDTINGCPTQDVDGSMVAGCQRIVSFTGRDNGYLTYTLNIFRGLES